MLLIFASLGRRDVLKTKGSDQLRSTLFESGLRLKPLLASTVGGSDAQMCVSACVRVCVCVSNMECL